MLTLKVQYRLWADRRAAAALGAVLPPRLPLMIAGIDLMRAAMCDMADSYPCEPLALLGKTVGQMFSVRLLFKDRVFGLGGTVTTEPEHLKFNSFEKGDDMRAIFDPLLGTGVFAADGEFWKFHRAMTRPFFKRDRISDFKPFDRHSLDAIAQIRRRLHEGYAIDFHDMISRSAMDASGESLFGDNAQTLAAGLPYRASAPTQHHPHWLTRPPHLRAPSTARMDAATKRRVKDPAPVDREVQEGETLVDHLLNYTEDRTILRDEVLNISVAARDTTASLLTFVVLSVVGPTRAPTPADFREMKYLRAVLNETMGCILQWEPLNMRSTTRPFVFPSAMGGRPFYLPAKSKVPFSVMVLHRRTDLWGPGVGSGALHRRTAKGNSDPNPFIFLPFNAGPRICLGQQFAYHETSFFLVRLLQTFSGMTLVLDAQPPAGLAPQAWTQHDDDKRGWKRGERLKVKNHITLYLEERCSGLAAVPLAGAYGVLVYTDLSRPQCSVLTQLRTAHAGLNAYLYRFHLTPSPDCPLCLVPETVGHFLLTCPRFRRQRLCLIMKLGTARLSLRLLLAAKSDHKPVLAFVRDTECLPRYTL
ncbi:cytochrome P450 [Mycena latifolia]|nr:cytochrome P450 [Mycena latifolia]